MARSESALEEPQDHTGDSVAEQTTLGEFAGADIRCSAIAVATNERCRHPAVPGTEYCTQHIDWDEYETG
jgi:hypothetical protein